METGTTNGNYYRRNPHVADDNEKIMNFLRRQLLVLRHDTINVAISRIITGHDDQTHLPTRDTSYFYQNQISNKDSDK